MKASSPKRNKQIGIILLIFPLVFMFSVLFSFAVINIIMHATSTSAGQYSTLTSLSAGQTGLRSMALTITNFGFGVMGLAALVSFFVGIPLGIYFITRKEHFIGEHDQRSGKGDDSEIPKEIKHWNWGAFLLPWIWGIYNKVWLSLLVFVPIIGVIFRFVLALKGSEWAWMKNKWTSVDSFKKSQRKWALWSICLIAIPIIIFIFTVACLPFLGPNKRALLSSRIGNTITNIQVIRGDKVKYSINYDANKWAVKKNGIGEAREYSFVHRDGDVYAGVITERIEMPLNTLKEAALENARERLSDLAVTYEGKQVIDDKEFLVMKFRGTAQGINFSYYAHYYSGGIGSIQFVAYTTQNLFLQYEKDFTELLRGLKLPDQS